MTSHYVTWDRLRHGRKSIAICGDWVDGSDISNEPSCPECRRELDLTAEQAFGPRTSGTQVPHQPFDVFAGYRPKGPK